MNKSLNILLAALMYVAFYGLIGASVYYTKSAWPLWALIFTPTLDVDL